jgi:hypothetical protein
MTNPTMKSLDTKARRETQGAPGPKTPPPPLIKLGASLKEAILLIMAYVRQATGTEPSQDEIAAVLKSYFTLDEVTNQINYLRKKPAGDESADQDSSLSRLCVRINLMSGPPKNSLARAGYFIRPLAEGIVGIRKHAKATLGEAPSEGDVARSLKSSFILSEIKNQIVHARKSGR